MLSSNMGRIYGHKPGKPPAYGERQVYDIPRDTLEQRHGCKQRHGKEGFTSLFVDFVLVVLYPICCGISKK
jgi:hypothetical protein